MISSVVTPRARPGVVAENREVLVPFSASVSCLLARPSSFGSLSTAQVGLSTYSAERVDLVGNYAPGMQWQGSVFRKSGVSGLPFVRIPVAMVFSRVYVFVLRVAIDPSDVFRCGGSSTTLFW